MKCVRDTGFNEYYAQFDKRCRMYRKKFWKQTSPFSRRVRNCTKALLSIKHKNHKTYYRERVNFEVNFRTYKKKHWQ